MISTHEFNFLEVNLIGVNCQTKFPVFMGNYLPRNGGYEWQPGLWKRAAPKNLSWCDALLIQNTIFIGSFFVSEDTSP